MVRGVTLRPAEAADSRVLLRWRNDPETRRWSRRSAPVAEAEHIEWLRQSLLSASRRLLIAEIGTTAVGSVRIDCTADGYELSWTVAPENRGRGVGTEMVRLACQLLTGRVYAHVKAGNAASSRIALAAGLRLESSNDEFLCFAAVRGPAPAASGPGGDHVTHG